MTVFLIFADLLLFAVLFIDEDTFINLTVGIGVCAYVLIAIALLIIVW